MRSDPEFLKLQALLGARLRARRAEMGLTQEAAAARAGYGWRHLQKLEAGEVNPTLLTLFRLAEVYETTVSELLAGSRPAAPEHGENG